MAINTKNAVPLQLQSTILHDVVITPERYGFFGAWCDGQPVPLAHRLRDGIQSRKQIPWTKPQKIVEEPCIWGGVLEGHYGHFIIESMQSLYAFQQNPDRKIIWSGSSTQLSPWQKYILEQTGCMKNGFDVLDRPTLFRNMLFPVPGLLSNTWLMPEQAEAFAFYKTAPRKGRRVWLSRSDVDTDNRIFTNERELEDTLKLRGWEIYAPEKHSLEHQLETIGSSEVVMGFIGSAFHTLYMLTPFPTGNSPRFIVLDRMNGARMAHSQLFYHIAKARTDNYFVWQPPKHPAPALYRRKVHAGWPWFALEIETIVRELDARNDFSGDMKGIPDMISINDVDCPNEISKPVLFDLSVKPTDRLYYQYRKVRKALRPVKNMWVDFLQKICSRRK